jgi:hypothetical protein
MKQLNLDAEIAWDPSYLAKEEETAWLEHVAERGEAEFVTRCETLGVPFNVAVCFFFIGS